jgi:hypothetical protein
MLLTHNTAACRGRNRKLAGTTHRIGFHQLSIILMTPWTTPTTEPPHRLMQTDEEAVGCPRPLDGMRDNPIG